MHHNNASSSRQDNDVIENIEAAYFIEEGFDAIDYELKVNGNIPRLEIIVETL